MNLDNSLPAKPTRSCNTSCEARGESLIAKWLWLAHVSDEISDNSCVSHCKALLSEIKAPYKYFTPELKKGSPVMGYLLRLAYIILTRHEPRYWQAINATPSEILYSGPSLQTPVENYREMKKNWAFSKGAFTLSQWKVFLSTESYRLTPSLFSP